MTFQVSPGVQVKEIDLTSIIPSVSTTRAGFAGVFNKGPVGSRTLISSVNQLRSVFGDPTDANAVDWFTAANFLAYTNNLQVVRVVGTAATNASVKGSGDDRLIKTVSDYDAQFGVIDTDGYGASMGGTFGTFAARGPGGEVNQGGNALQVSVADRTTLGIRLIGVTGGGVGSELTTSGGLVGTQLALGSAYGDTSKTGSILTDQNPIDTDKTMFYIVEKGDIVTSGLPFGVTGNNADGKNEIANVGNTAGDNLRIKGLPAEPLRTITGITPGYIATIATQVDMKPGGAAVNLSVHVPSTAKYLAVDGNTGGFVVIHGSTGGVSADMIARVISTSTTGLTMTVGVTCATSGIEGGLRANVGDFIQFVGEIEVGSTAAGQGGLTAASVDWRYRSNFSRDLPATSIDAQNRGATNDLIHIAVMDEFGIGTGNTFEVLETFDSVSKASNVLDSFGKNIFMQQRVRGDSSRVFLTGFADVAGGTVGGVTAFGGGGGNTVGPVAKVGVTHGSLAQSGRVFNTLIRPSTVSLTGGTLGAAVTNKITDGYDAFEDPETVDVNVLVGGDLTGAQAKSLITILDKRRDCLGFFSPPRDAVLDSAGAAPKSALKATANTVAYRKGTNANESGGDQDFTTNNLNSDTSFAVMDSGWKLTFDRYTDKFRYIPLNADTAGVTVRTDVIAEPWFSPAGFNRGQILGAVALAYSPNQAERDDLYTNNINPVVAFPGQGTVLFGDKTMQQRPSAFDRINVRRLFIILEKAIATAAKFQLFEINDAFTRAQFKSIIDPFLRDVQARRGVVDFKVICDDSNNPASVVDRNEFVASIFIKPSRSINFITLNFIATGSGVNFQEIGA